MTVDLIGILAAQQPGHYSALISDLDTNDPRTQAVKRALAHYHEGVYAKYEDTEFSRFGYITGNLKIDWDEPFKDIPYCMNSFYYEAVKRCVAARKTFETAIMFLFDRLGRRICLYRMHATDDEINEWIRQVVHEIYNEFMTEKETFEKIHFM